MRWLGHILKMPQEHITHKALRWTPPGKRKPGRPKTTWQRTVETELREMGLTWGEARKVAKNQDSWRRIVMALCRTRGEEEEGINFKTCVMAAIDSFLFALNNIQLLGNTVD